MLKESFIHNIGLDVIIFRIHVYDYHYYYTVYFFSLILKLIFRAVILKTDNALLGVIPSISSA